VKAFKETGIDIRKGADKIVRRELGGCSIYALVNLGGPVGKEPGLQRP